MVLGVAQRVIVIHIVPMFLMRTPGATLRREISTLGVESLVRLVGTAPQIGFVQALVAQDGCNVTKSRSFQVLVFRFRY